MTTNMRSRHAFVATPAGGLAFRIAIRDHELLTDQPESLGGADRAPTPLELLGAALASCVALYVHKHCQSRGFADDGLAVEVKPVWRDGRIARFDLRIQLPAGVPATEYPAIEAVAHGCPVHATLSTPPDIGVEIIPLPLGAAA